MRKSPIAPTLIILFLIVVSSFTAVSIKGSFDWHAFVVYASLLLLGISFDIYAHNCAENCQAVLLEKLMLYKMLNEKIEQLYFISDIIRKKNNTYIEMQVFWQIADFFEKTDDLLQTICEELKKGKESFRNHLKNIGIRKSVIRKIMRLLRFYDQNNFLEIIRIFETKELIAKRQISLFSILLTGISVVLTVFGFCGIDIEKIDLNLNFIIVSVIFSINILDSYLSFRWHKKNLMDYYKKIQNIVEELDDTEKCPVK